MNRRELKFRVWHKELKRWLNSEEWFLNFGGELYFYDLGDKIPLSSDKENKLVKANNENYIIQQFTGLLDKNNKEIYEGDLILFKDIIYEIIYQDGAFRFGGNIKDCAYAMVPAGISKFGEIKGNIFKEKTS